MRKLVYIIGGVVLISVLFALFSKKRDARDRLEDLIDTMNIETYRFEKEVCQVNYPTCFKVSSEDSNVVRFIMVIDNKTKIGLTCYVEPNVEGWNVKEAPDSLIKDSRKPIFKYVGHDYFVLYEDNLGDCSFEKTYLIANKWYSYTLYYHKSLERQVECLMALVLAWHPGGVAQDEKENMAVLAEWKHQLDVK